jgi:hypothetical protein
VKMKGYEKITKSDREWRRKEDWKRGKKKNV